MNLKQGKYQWCAGMVINAESINFILQDKTGILTPLGNRVTHVIKCNQPQIKYLAKSH